MIRLHFHRYRVARDTGFTRYLACPCGKRIVRHGSGGAQPIDRGWIETGQWTPMPGPPPRVETGVRR